MRNRAYTILTIVGVVIVVFIILETTCTFIEGRQMNNDIHRAMDRELHRDVPMPSGQ